MDDKLMSPKRQVEQSDVAAALGRCQCMACQRAQCETSDQTYRLVGENAQHRLYKPGPSPEMPPQPTPVEHMLHLQRAGMETLHTLVSVLEGRLERVLSAPQSTSPGHAQDLDGSGKLPQDMANVRASMVDLADRLESLTQRLLV